MRVSSDFNSAQAEDWLQRVDVRAKMLVCALASLTSMVISNFNGQLLLAGASFIYALSLRRPLALLAAYALTALMGLISLGCLKLMSLFIDSLWDSFELSALLIPFLRVLVMLQVVLPLALSVRLQAMLSALQSLKLPFCIYLPTAVVFRFLPSFGHDIRQIAESLRLRGFRLSPWSLTLHPVIGLRLLFTPLLLRALRSAEDLGIAAELKGLDGRRRPTPYRPSAWTKADSTLTTAAAAVSALALSCQLFWGSGQSIMP